MTNPFPLDEDQVRAARHDAKELLIVAGAGTGKTATLLERARILAERSGDPSKVLLLTFSRKAAKELRDRMSKGFAPPRMAESANPRDRMSKGFAPQDGNDIEASTLHAWAWNVLRRFVPAFRVRRPVSERNRRELLHGDSAEENPEELLEAMERLAAAGVREAAELPEGERGSSLLLRALERRKEYRKALADRRLWDFDELLFSCLEAFESSSDWPARLGLERILVDEAQDLSGLQWKILDRLRDLGIGLTWIGDPEQAIYGFRGALPESLASVAKRGVTVLALERNYRSDQSLLDLANAVLERSPFPLARRLVGRPGGEKPRWRFFPSERLEAEEIAREATRRGSMTVLARTRFRLLACSQAFARRGVRCRMTEPVALPEEALAHLAALRSPADPGALSDWARHAVPGFGAAAARKVSTLSPGEDVTRFHRTACALLPPARRLLFDEATHVLRDAREGILTKRGVDLSRALLEVLGGESWEEGARSLLREACAEAESLDGAVDLLELAASSDASGEESPFELMTIHQAKGLEWDHVAVVGLEEGTLPHERSLRAVPNEAALDEERRLLYVALTRARRSLFLSGAANARSHGALRSKEASRYVAWMREELEGRFVTLSDRLGDGEEHPYF